MSGDKVNVYHQNQKTTLGTTGNSRDTDSRALAACARRLEEARDNLAANLKSKDALKEYGDAIRHNQRLWTIFQVAVADPQNPLPHDLKLTLLNLGRYVDKTSFRATGKYEPGLIDSLIEINRIIASGLNKPVNADALMPSTGAIGTTDTPTSLMTSA
ncbi:MAG: flagellar biosynthesis regulator FlaF [Alphaproteobacteria bacterium]|nr:flagellar biosynthesis regulator FlaF [Alphaproteobacteria bacterium]